MKRSASSPCQKPSMSVYSFLPMLFESNHFLLNESWLPLRYVWVFLAFFILGVTPGYAEFIMEIPKIKTGPWLGGTMSHFSFLM